MDGRRDGGPPGLRARPVSVASRNTGVTTGGTEHTEIGRRHHGGTEDTENSNFTTEARKTRKTARHEELDVRTHKKQLLWVFPAVFRAFRASVAKLLFSVPSVPPW
jgi:hypothetical protein